MKFQSLVTLALLAACSSSKPHYRAQSSSTAQRLEEGKEQSSPAVSAADFRDHPGFVWPTRYPYIQAYFGWRKKRMHEGLDLKAPTGTRVYSTASGEIIEAGSRIRGYGKTVVVDHGNGWASIYAHLSKIKVKRGDHVGQGELLALSGRTGRATGPHLHFEIRKGSDPLDPLMFLPPVEGDDNDSESLGGSGE
jgi:murein DD-endopeptidase MepM/ murein hydrolase activator NlpD